MAKRKVCWIDVVRYDTLDKTIIRFYRDPEFPIISTEIENPSRATIGRVAMAVVNDPEFRVRPFLANCVGWVAVRR